MCAGRHVCSRRLRASANFSTRISSPSSAYVHYMFNIGHVNARREKKRKWGRKGEREGR